MIELIKKWERSNFINEHALNREPVPFKKSPFDMFLNFVSEIVIRKMIY